MIAGLHHEWAGRADEGAPVLLLSSGLGGSAGYWAPNLPALGKRYRTLAYDHRGTGRSDRAVPDRETIETMADDVLRLMDALDVEQADFMGHALGGLIGLAVALKAPARLGRIVVVNGWIRPDPHTIRCFEARLALLADSGPRAYLRAQPIFLYPASWISQHSADIDADEPHHLAAMPPAGVIARRIRAILTFDPADRLGEIAAPVLAIAAEDDMLAPAFCSSALADALPQGRFAALPWGGHACNVTYPARFDRVVLDFLSGRAAPKGRLKGAFQS